MTRIKTGHIIAFLTGGILGSWVTHRYRQSPTEHTIKTCKSEGALEYSQFLEYIHAGLDLRYNDRSDFEALKRKGIAPTDAAKYIETGVKYASDIEELIENGILPEDFRRFDDTKWKGVFTLADSQHIESRYRVQAAIASKMGLSPELVRDYFSKSNSWCYLDMIDIQELHKSGINPDLYGQYMQMGHMRLDVIMSLHERGIVPQKINKRVLFENLE